MTAALAETPIDRFRSTVTRRLGLVFDDSKDDFLIDVMQRRAEASGLSVPRYLEQLRGPAPPRHELRELAKDLTITETYFFRHMEQLRAFAEAAVPDRLAARPAIRQLRVLSAGCASGEEVYSLAILLRELGMDPSWVLMMAGADINAGMLDRAARARYSSWALRETPPEVLRRWFSPIGRDFALDPAIRGMVTFCERNLADPTSDLWVPGAYDVIFCRNVIMYFAPDEARALVERMTVALAPGGYLFLGHAETLRGLSQDFHLRHTHETFYYQRKDGPAATLPAPAWIPGPAESTETPAPAVSGVPLPGPAWMETVQHASDRIRDLVNAPAPAVTASPPESPAGNHASVGLGVGLALALELLKRERFSEALALIRQLPASSAQDPDVLLLQAALLSHSGQLRAAESACADLLSIDELSAGAHYVLAQCRDAAGDRQAARDHDQAAIYLDPAFAMPRLHLGLMARRAGERESAQRELGQALHLLQTEDPSRLLLFGGGFNRASLLALCRGELQAAGGKP